MMPFLVVVVVVLFAGVQLFQWLLGIILPLPIYVMAGAFLAIASNYDKGMAVLINRGQGLWPHHQTPGATMTAELESPRVNIDAVINPPELTEQKSLNGDQVSP
ncbi:hypothetical protein [Synechocystis salina]|uniref:Uncharacterized protein n=1 Tax=Synechocystis salina LEGE 00031 TaxID=1828736 RepID=A0ABR9VW03_9SYNC|nr:hypothetical protein [Synechocystis salina]MBE9242404.1 hypothetical protein [Synechocystis salina LEGE 00041]MBE9255519.1 hypothetical protein [Synechocystis salina LEGE 00031]